MYLFLPAADCKKVCDLLGVPILQEYNRNDPPDFNDDVVWFNGIKDDGHETFFIPRVFDTDGYCHTDDEGRFFAFCKTARKPYDLPVCCCLLIFKQHFGDDFILSSGGEFDEEWREARDEVEKILGYTFSGF